MQGQGKKDQKPLAHVEIEPVEVEKIPDQISPNTYWGQKGDDDVGDITGTESVTKCHQHSEQASRKGC